MYKLGEGRIDPRQTDLTKIELKLYKNAELINSGLGSAVLGHPAAAVAWLAKSLANYGVSLNKGDLVLAGALSAAVPAQAGDEFTCDFGSFGSLVIKFEVD